AVPTLPLHDALPISTTRPVTVPSRDSRVNLAAAGSRSSAGPDEPRARRAMPFASPAADEPPARKAGPAMRIWLSSRTYRYGVPRSEEHTSELQSREK